ncbi:MAG: hypothetical protein KJ954_07605 [Alphaproteobacteria bacterium]|nr:hypothetical protein [Alphaproteobacteria bacterium]
MSGDTPIDLDAYFKRIGYSGSRAPTLAFRRRSAHLRGVDISFAKRCCPFASRTEVTPIPSQTRQAAREFSLWPMPYRRS